MTIDFQCENCGRTLRCASEHIGRSIKCPECNRIQIVPQFGPLDASPSSEVPLFPSSDTEAVPEQHYNPYAVQSIEPKAPEQRSAIGNVVPDVGIVLNHAFSVWKANFGILLAATLIIFGVNFGISMLNSVFQGMATALNKGQDPWLPASIAVACNLIGWVVGIFFQIGLVRFNLQILRGGPAEIGLLFQGGDKFLPVLWFNIVSIFLLLIGFLLLIVPGIILLLMYWPAYYLIIDRKVSTFEAYAQARIITRGNILNTILLYFITLGIAILGLLACCIGIIPASSLIAVLQCTAYLAMSGQLRFQSTAESLPPAS